MMKINPCSICVSSSDLTKSKGGISVGDVVSMVLITIFVFIGAYILSILDKKHKKR